MSEAPQAMRLPDQIDNVLHPDRLDYIGRGNGARYPGQEIVILVLALAGDERALGEEGSEIPGEDVEVGGGLGGIGA